MWGTDVFDESSHTRPRNPTSTEYLNGVRGRLLSRLCRIHLQECDLTRIRISR
jgi:hypothetical protein